MKALCLAPHEIDIITYLNEHIFGIKGDLFIEDVPRPNYPCLSLPHVMNSVKNLSVCI